jgi:GNAT superfamily N-acetyltransferase
MESKGQLHLLAARDEGRLVGYYLGIIVSHPHYASSGLMSFTDVYFLCPEYRRGEYGVALFAEAERTLRERGVYKAYLSCKIHKDLSPLFELLGWRKTDYTFCKVL